MQRQAELRADWAETRGQLIGESFVRLWGGPSDTRDMHWNYWYWDPADSDGRIAVGQEKREIRQGWLDEFGRFIPDVELCFPFALAEQERKNALENKLDLYILKSMVRLIHGELDMGGDWDACRARLIQMAPRSWMRSTITPSTVTWAPRRDRKGRRDPSRW